MDDNASNALMMAFFVMLLVIALAVAMRMFSQVVSTAEILTLYSDSTVYYDNVEIQESSSADNDIKTGTARVVSAETIIPTLYRYYKENFCVKIYDATGGLLQVFDVNLEGKVEDSIKDSTATISAITGSSKANYAYKTNYNDNAKPYYMFGAPWLGSTESIKTRIDLYVNGKAGYINDTYVDYTDNSFYQARLNKTQFKENFINYSYTGQTLETEDGDVLVTGASAKDKIVIIYTMIDESITP